MSLPATDTNNKPSTAPFLQSINTELHQVDDVLRMELSSVVRTVFAASRHILDAGGKRLRPSLVILSARVCSTDCDTERTVAIAAGVELIHMATLMHDDVIDGADSRRGRKTANSLWNNQVSVLTGDYMLSKATSLLGRDGDIRLIQALSLATTAMTEGEIRQIEARGDTRALSDHYLDIIRDKTAAFMSFCCRLGGIVTKADPAVEELLAQYGLNLGLAFQITDDVLDLIGDPEVTGKPVGGDIREGKITLPLILALEKANPADRAKVEEIVHGDGATTKDMEFIRTLIDSADAIEDSRSVAAGYIKQAIECLISLPESDYRTSLEDMARYVLRRKK